jgi:phage terminase large subunit
MFVASRCFVRGNRLFVDYEVTKHKAGVDEYPTLLAQLPDAEHIQIIADRSRPESIKYIREHGFPKIYGALEGTGSVVEGIKFMQSYDEIVIHTRCKETIKGFGTYSYDVDKKTGIVKTTINHAGSDPCDAVRYACEILRRGAGAYAYGKQQSAQVVIKPKRW